MTAARYGGTPLVAHGALWCVWSKPPYRRAPDFAGALGRDCDAEAAALEHAGPGATRNDTLARGVLRALRRAGEMPTPGPLERLLVAPVAPLPVTHAACWNGPEGTAWCVWFTRPKGKPDLYGFVPTKPAGGSALREVFARTLPVVRWLPPVRAQVWYELDLARVSHDASPLAPPREGTRRAPAKGAR